MRLTADNHLDTMLDQLRQAGAQDSEGRFTLDPARARELLQRHQLAAPEHYVLAALTSAVASGADLIRVKAGPGGCRVEHDAPPLSAYQLENMFSWLLIRERERQHLRELALAVNAGLDLRPRELSVRCTDGETAVTARYHDQGVDITREKCPDPPSTTLELKRPRQLGTLFNTPPEAQLVADNFIHCPVPVEVNGHRVSRDLDRGPQLAILRVDSKVDARWLRIPLETAEAPIFSCDTQPARYSVLVGLGGGVTSGVEYLIYGRSYLAPLPWELPGVRIVIATDRLSRDLSQLYLVEDEVYRNLQLRLWGHLLDLLGELEVRRTSLNPAHAVEALPYLDFLADCQCRSGRHAEARELQTWACQTWDRLPRSTDGVRKGLTCHKLALLARRSGDAELEQAMGQEAERTWSTLSGDTLHLLNDEVVDARVYIRWEKTRAVETVFGPEAPELVEYLEEQASLAETRYQYLEAQRYRRWGLAVREKVLGPDHPDLLEDYAAFGRLLMHANRLNEARPVYGRALSLYLEAKSPDSLLLEEIVLNLATVEGGLGNLNESCDLLGRGLHLLRGRHGDRAPELRKVLNQLAETLEKVGRGQEARQFRAWLARIPHRRRG